MGYLLTKFITYLVAVLGVFGLITGFALLMAFPTKWIVNYLFTPGVIFSLFGIERLDVWHGLALNFLGGMLFKGSSSK